MSIEKQTIRVGMPLTMKENMELDIKPVSKQQNLYEVVAGNLKEAIIQGRLTPGQVLPNETQLALQMGVSRPVIREALRYLQAQGLIHISRGTKGGAVVGSLDSLYLLENVADMIRVRKLKVDHLIQVRQFMEPEVFRLAAENATQEELTAIEELLERTGQEQEVDQKMSLNAEFHMAVSRACGNPIYAAMMSKVLEFTLAFVRTLKPKQIILHEDEDHLIIFRALQERNAPEASRLLLEHVNGLHEQIRSLETTWLQMQADQD